MKPLVYLATPYRVVEDQRKHLTLLELQDVEELRFRAACRIARHLRDAGLYPFCPMSHTLPVEEETESAEAEYWLAWDQAFIEACASCVVGQLPAWHLSLGVTAEVQEFRRQNKPVMHFHPRRLFTYDEWYLLELPVSAPTTRITH